MIDDSSRHNEKMAKKKQARDKIMSTKTDKKGLVIIHTGKGKGKSSAAFGMIFRCIAHDMKSAVVQFIKGGMDTGERNLITILRFARSIRWVKALHGRRKTEIEISKWLAKRGSLPRS